jgi:hypothetical protein
VLASTDIAPCEVYLGQHLALALIGVGIVYIKTGTSNRATPVSWMSPGGTKLPIRDVRVSVAIGGKPENICSV